MANELVVLGSHNGIEIPRREDGFINATQICRACGKLWADYWRQSSTQEYVQAVSVDMGIPISTLTESRKGGNRHEQGTYVHELIACHLAQWCSPAFAVQVNKWLRELLTKGTVSIAEPVRQPGPWLQRIGKTVLKHRAYIAGRGKEWGHSAFSVLTATISDLAFWEDEMVEHLLPIKRTDLPDGSVGKRWANYRRDKGLADTDLAAPLEVNTAIREVQVAVYRGNELESFLGWFREVYMRYHASDYLIKKFRKEKTPDLELPAFSAIDNFCRSTATDLRVGVDERTLELIDEAPQRRIKAGAALPHRPKRLTFKQ